MKTPLFEWLPAVLLRLMVGSALVYAGFMKAVGPQAEFAAIIEAYRILPAFWATPLALSLPWVEMWIGLFVLWGLYSRWSSVLASALIGIFAAAIGSTLIRHIDLASCGCFGPDRLSPHRTILLDLLLLACSIGLVHLSRQARRFTLDSLLSRRG